jgi:hypothetical protein
VSSGEQGTLAYAVVPQWSFFSRVGNSKTLRELARWFVLVPVIAKLLATLTKEATQTKQLDFVYHLTMPFDWQLLYYSAFSFMLAELIYSLRSPSLFRDFPSYFNFSRSVQETRELIDYILEVGKFGKSNRVEERAVIEILKLADDPRDHIALEGQLADVEDVEQALRSATFQDQERLLRRHIWRFCNRCRLTARALCCAFYGIGFSLLALAFASDLHAVLRQSANTHLLEHIGEVLGF